MYLSLQQRLLNKGKKFQSHPLPVPSFVVVKVLGKSLIKDCGKCNQGLAKRLTFSKLQVDLDSTAGKVMMGTLNNLSPNLTGVWEPEKGLWQWFLGRIFSVSHSCCDQGCAAHGAPTLCWAPGQFISLMFRFISTCTNDGDFPVLTVSKTKINKSVPIEETGSLA